MPTVHPCPVCGRRLGMVLSQEARDGTALTTMLCGECGVARTDPMPSETELADYYATQYRLEYKGVMAPKKKHVLRAGWLARERLSRLKPRLQSGARVLDLGAGGGEFVALALAAGLQAEGIEPNAGYATYAADILGLPVREGRWQDAAVASETLAAVTLFHVLEHLPEPVACLNHVCAWLQPGGYVLIEVPNLVAPLGTRKRRFHRAHLLHFTPTTLAAAVESAGLRVVEASAPGDGGNAVVLAQRMDRDPSPARDAGVSDGIGEAVAEILRFEQSSPMALALWLPHAKRLARRAGMAVREQWVARRFRDGRSLIESLQQGRA